MIRTERLELLVPTADLARAIARYYADNAEHLAPWSPVRPPGFATEPFWRVQADRVRAEIDAGTGVRLFAVTHERPDGVIGTVSLSNIVRGVLLQCFMGYDLAERAQGQGYGREMVGAAVEYAFGELGLHRVSANYMPHNRRSGALLRSLGFVVEGYARDYLAIAGRWEDHVLTAKVNPRVAPP